MARTASRPKSIWVQAMTTAERVAITFPVGEPVWDTTLGSLYIGDGATAGGVISIASAAPPGDTVVTEDGFGQSSTAGAQTAYSRKDHTHGTMAAGVPNATTPLAVSVAGVSGTTVRTDHRHQSPGGVASIIGEVSIASSAAEVQIIGASVPANFMQAGTTFRIRAAGVISTDSSAPTGTWNVRVGQPSLSGNIMCTVAPALDVSLVSVGWSVEAIITIRETGAPGNGIANMHVIGSSSLMTVDNETSQQTVAVNVDTTAINIVELTFKFSAAHASNVLKAENATVEVVVM